MTRVRSVGALFVVFIVVGVMFLTGAVRGAPLAAQQSQGMATPQPTPPVEAGGTLPGNPAIQLVQVAGGLVDPINVANAGDGSGRLFVIERIGRIRIIDKDGKLVEEPFLDIQDDVKTDFLEQGLLGSSIQPGLRRQRPVLHLLRRLHHQRQPLHRAIQGVRRRPEQGRPGQRQADLQHRCRPLREPQRRGDPVRTRWLSVLDDRRRRPGRRSVRQRPEPPQPVRQDPPHRRQRHR